MNGFFTINRELFDHPLWQTSTSEQKVILIVIIGMMNHTPKKWIWKGEEIEVDRGQRITTVAEIKRACGCGVSEKQIRTAIKKFKKFDFLSDQVSHDGHLITVENYSKWQGESSEGVTPTGRRWAGDGQETGRRRESLHYKNNENNDNNDNNIYITPNLGEFGNVRLTEEELEKLKERFPYDYQDRIERLSEYVASKGKRYKSHYATICSWARKESKGKEEQQERKKYDFKPCGN